MKQFVLVVLSTSMIPNISDLVLATLLSFCLIVIDTPSKMPKRSGCAEVGTWRNCFFRASAAVQNQYETSTEVLGGLCMYAFS